MEVTGLDTQEVRVAGVEHPVQVTLFDAQFLDSSLPVVDVLGELRSSGDASGCGVVGFDISKRGTGLAYVYFDEERRQWACVTASVVLPSKVREYSALMRLLQCGIETVLARWGVLTAQGCFKGVFVVEDVFRSANARTFRLLSVLNVVPDLVRPIYACSEDFTVRVQSTLWKSWLFSKTVGVFKGDVKSRIVQAVQFAGIEVPEGIAYQDRYDAVGMVLGTVLFRSGLSLISVSNAGDSSLQVFSRSLLD